MKMYKRITAFLISAAIMMNTSAALITSSAETGERYTYTCKGYTVEYTVKGEWQGHQNIEVVVTNTGDEILSGWSMGYNAGGEISGLWNAKVYGQQGTEYILCGESYNSEIAPGASVNFGYTLEAESFQLPQNIWNCSERVDITEDYRVYYNIVGDYGSSYQAEMVIENNSSADISAWKLDFEGDWTIDNLWNGKLLSNKNYHFSVKGAENNGTIYAGDSVSFNFMGTKPAQDITLGFSDGEEPMDMYEEVFRNYKLTGVTIPLEFDFDMDLKLDSDEDGLPDYIERTIGTDRYNPDTDGDGLSDSVEYYWLDTDPTKADTDGNGISDADEDFDEDGLTNGEEIDLGTSPLSPDTDNDGLSDYEELYVHGTDPLDSDTDKDKVTDGDEVILGLDPNNPATNGYPDNEYTTDQTVDTDSPALDGINGIDDNPFQITVDITAAGVADNCLKVDESGYSGAVSGNESIVGAVPELSYDEGLTISDVTINFAVDESEIHNGNPESDSLERFTIWKYFEDENVLLPVETTYDESRNTVSANVPDVGTYCLVDTAKWAEMIAKAEKGKYYLKGDENDPANIVLFMDERCVNDYEFDEIKKGIDEIAKDAFGRYTDIKFYLAYQKFGSNFKAENAFVKDSYGKDYFTSYASVQKALDSLQADSMKSGFRSEFAAYDYVSATQFVIDSCDENKIILYHIASDDRVMGSSDKVKRLLSELKEEERIYVNTLLPFSTKSVDPDSYIAMFAETTKGVAATNTDVLSFFEEENETEEVSVQMLSSTNETVVSVEYAEESVEDKGLQERIGRAKFYTTYILGEGDRSDYTIITSTGVPNIKLEEKLKKDSGVDTDNDGADDWEEVDIDLIFECLHKREPQAIPQVNRYSNTVQTSQLPTYDEIKDHISKKYDESFKLDNETIQRLTEDDNIRILPIHSDPTNEDSDDDGLLDGKAVHYNYPGRGDIALAPTDPEPMRRTGPNGLWKKRIAEIKNGHNVAYDYWSWADDLFRAPEKLVWEAKRFLSVAIREKSVFSTIIDLEFADLETKLCLFRYDKKRIAIHSDAIQWQKIAGYNDFYDNVFRSVTGMIHVKLDFRYDEENYVIWAWKAPYLQLGAGTEVGFYKQGDILQKAPLEHWRVGETLPMTLSMYLMDGDNYESCFYWFPKEDQWWITGFMPDMTSIKSEQLYQIASVDFSGNPQMLGSLCRYNKEEIDNQTIIIDQKENMLWLAW